MSAIDQFALSGVWDDRNMIVPMAVGVPLAVEGAILAKNIYEKPEVVREGLASLKNKIIEFFTLRPDEERSDGIKRIAKNWFCLLLCLALMAVACYFSATLLPTTFAITTALSSVVMIGKCFVNGAKYKQQIVDAFSVHEGESMSDAKRRIGKNILKVALFAIGLGLAMAFSICVLWPMFSNGFSWMVPLPFQTKGVVFAEYASLGLIHGGLAYKKWKEGNRAGALFHIFAAAMSFIFPAFYWNTDMRLHHSFYGLALMATPYRPLQYFGSLVTLDSALYFIEPWRGYISMNAAGLPQKNEYDFINTVVDNYSLYAGCYTGALALEDVNNAFDNASKAGVEPATCRLGGDRSIH